jgi:hypothetical protein
MAMEAILAALEAAAASKKTGSSKEPEAPRQGPEPPRRATQPVARRRGDDQPSRLVRAEAEVMPAFDAIDGYAALPMHLVDLEHEGPRPTGVLSGLFEDGKGLLRAVVAAEVLAPPLMLREQSNWSPPPNAPST